LEPKKEKRKEEENEDVTWQFRFTQKRDNRMVRVIQMIFNVLTDCKKANSEILNKFRFNLFYKDLKKTRQGLNTCCFSEQDMFNN
jgi:hypothetical protein